MSYIEVTGKTEDEAIQKALAQLGLDRDDVSVEILERAKSGFLGLGACPAKIRVTYGETEDVLADLKPMAPVVKEERKSVKPQQPKEEKKPERKAEKPKQENHSEPKAEETTSCCCGKPVDGICCIKVLGSGCKSCHALLEATKEAVKNMGLNIEVEYVTDMEKIMEYGVMSMPALVVNEQIASMGKVLKAAEVEKLLCKYEG